MNWLARSFFNGIAQWVLSIPQWFLDQYGWPGLAAVIGAVFLAIKILKRARRPFLALGCLILALVGAAVYLPKAKNQTINVQELRQQVLPPFRRAGKPSHPAVTEPPAEAAWPSPLSQRRRAAIRAVQQQYRENMKLHPERHTPEAREARLQVYIARERERQRLEKLAQRQKTPRVLPAPVTLADAEELRWQMHEQHLRQADESLRAIQQKYGLQPPTMIGGVPGQRRR
jgi:hypothetical protein